MTEAVAFNSDKASSLLEKALLKFMMQHVTHATDDLKLDSAAIESMSDFVHKATAKKVIKRFKQHKCRLSTFKTDLAISTNVQEFLRALAADDLPVNEMFPASLKEQARSDADKENVVDKWSDFCKNTRNLCLLVRAYSVMDEDFLKILDKIVQLVADEMGGDGDGDEQKLPTFDVQQLMMSLMLRGDINITEMASSMRKIMERDPDMIRDCLGTIMAILKESGIQPPDLGGDAQNALQALSISVPQQQDASLTTETTRDNSINRLMHNFSRLDGSA